MEELLTRIVKDDQLHISWLATLSHLENCGARKIIAFEPSLHVPLDILQHAAEETRHAFFFKKLIKKIEKSPPFIIPLLGGPLGRRYLHKLDLKICRCLKTKYDDLDQRSLQRGSYLLTTYAIEKRAEALYPLYERILRQEEKNFSVLSVIKEEENHLLQIEREIDREKHLLILKDQVLNWERELFEQFKASLQLEVDASVH